MEWSDIAKGLGYTGGGALGGLGINWMLGNTSTKSRIISALLGAGAGAGVWGLGHLNTDLSGDKDPLTKNDAARIAKNGKVSDKDVTRAKNDPTNPISKAVLNLGTDQNDLQTWKVINPIMNPNIIGGPWDGAVTTVGSGVGGYAIGNMFGVLPGTAPNTKKLVVDYLMHAGNPADAKAFDFLHGVNLGNPGRPAGVFTRFFNPQYEAIESLVNQYNKSVAEATAKATTEAAEATAEATAEYNLKLNNADEAVEQANVARLEAEKNLKKLETTFNQQAGGQTTGAPVTQKEIAEARDKVQRTTTAWKQAKKARSRIQQQTPPAPVSPVQPTGKTYDYETVTTHISKSNRSRYARKGAGIAALSGLAYSILGSLIGNTGTAVNERQIAKDLEELKKLSE